MALDRFFYAGGVAFWGIVTIALVALLALLLWFYLSISISYWYAHVKTGAIKKEYAKKSFYKTRLLLLILRKPKIAFDLQNSTCTSEKFALDYTGLCPKITIYKSL